MRTPKRSVRGLRSSVVACIVVGIVTLAAVGHEPAVVHRGITDRAFQVSLPNSDFYDVMHPNARIDAMDGSFDEDAGLKPLGHFYNPETMSAPSFGTGGPATLNAQQAWDEACMRYHQEEYSGTTGAFHSLGRALHFIQDMTSPAHTHDDQHLFDPEDFEDWGPANFPAYGLSGVSPRFASDLSASGAVHEVATITYNLTSYDAELYEIAGSSVQPSSVLQGMFPSLHWDDGGFFGDAFWEIDDVGEFENGLNPDEWWVVPEDFSEDNSGPGGVRRVYGNVYIENTGGMSGAADGAVPAKFNGVSNTAGTGLLRLYGDNLYPIAVAYCAGLLQLFATQLDLVFVVDTTGSMFDDIDAVKLSATEIVDEIADVLCLYRVAIVSYEDFPVLPYGDPFCGDNTFHDVLGFTDDRDEIVNGIQSLVLRCGADYEESVYSALMHTIALPWRMGDDIERAIILMGDAPGHDPEPFTGFTAASVIAAASSLSPGSGPSPISLVGSGVSIYSLLIGSDPDAKAQFSALADGTGGEVFEAATSEEVVAALVEALGTIIGGGNGAPDCTFAFAEPAQLWPPNNKMASITIGGVVDPDGDPISVTITGITQDEPVNQTGPGTKAGLSLGLKSVDGAGVGTSTASVRAERNGNGNGRMYQISFVADDGNGGQCSGSVLVSVAHDQGANTIAIDDGQDYDSTLE